MKDALKNCKIWIKEHKKELAVAGITIVSAICMVMACKNKDEILEVMSHLKDELSKKRMNEIPETFGNYTHREDSLGVIEDVLTDDLVIGTDGFDNVIRFDVKRHIRNLPIGQTASLEKVNEAKSLGIILQPGQTIVDGYEKTKLNCY